MRFLDRCDLVLPCRDEAAALVLLLPTVPRALRVIVVDNGSRDDTAEVAAELGATVVAEPEPGYGAAVQRGVETATRDFVAVMDADGSFDPASIAPLLAEVAEGRCDLALGRRRPQGSGAWPWPARAGNAVAVARLRHRTGLAVHDIAPLRVARRTELLALGVADRRFGYPVELLVRAGRAGWRVSEHDVPYLPRAAGTRSKVSGSVGGSLRAARDFARVLR